MTPARAPRERRSDARLLAVDVQSASFADLTAAELPALLMPGDLLVVNDAATLPASLSGRSPDGAALELRLLGPGAGELFRGVLLGAGDWRTPTEHRPPPPRLPVGARIALGPQFGAEVIAVSPISPRLVDIRFDKSGAALWAALYAHGKPVQYSYLQEDLALWSVQTVYAGRPWAAEMPSAGRPLSWEILGALQKRGVAIAWLTHAAGLSSTGDEAIDAALPLPERYDIPDTTVAAIARARRRGGRVLAVGTTVVRALEGAVRNAVAAGAELGTLPAGAGETDFILTSDTQLSVVNGILTGLHGPGESHFRLLSAFAPPSLLAAAFQHATERGYQCHEFGDLSLIAPGLAAPSPSARARA